MKLSGLGRLTAPLGYLSGPASAPLRAGSAAAAMAAGAASSAAASGAAAASGTARTASGAARTASGTARRTPAVISGAAAAASGAARAAAGMASTAQGAMAAATAAAPGAAAAAGQLRRAPGRIGGPARELWHAGERAAATVVAAADMGRRRTRRRVWSRGGRAHIEVRGLTGSGPAHRQLARAVTAALSSHKGVHWAEVNAATAQVLIDFDEEQADPDTLLDIVEAVEQAHGTQDGTFSWSAPAHPADDGPLAVAATALAADAVGMATAVTARMLRLTPLPRGVRTPLAFAQAQPRLRRAIAERAGPAGADLLLTLGNAVTHGLSQGYTPLAVDATHRLIQLIELRARQAVWSQKEYELHATGHALPQERPREYPRPVPLPPGPVERTADRTSLAAMAGAGALLGWTRDPDRASSLLLATVPRAAHLGREGFACTLGTQLARQGVVPLDGAALRRLDRISAVVIDSAVLCAPYARILAPVAGPGGEGQARSARNGHPRSGQTRNGRPGRGKAGDGNGGVPDLEAWQAAERILAGRPLADLAGPGPWADGGWRLSRVTGAGDQAALAGQGNGSRPHGSRPRAGHGGGDLSRPDGLTLELTDPGGRTRGRFLAGRELDQQAEAVLGAARDCAGRILLTGHVSTAELAPWADEVIPPGQSLTRQVRRLQEEGHGVLVLSAGQHQALTAADAGVAVVTAEHGVSWSADLVCGPGLRDAWRILCAVKAARLASERAARLSLGGSALGALLVTVGGGTRATRAGIAPVQSAALLAIGTGVLGARSVARLPEPVTAPRGDWHAMAADAVLARLAARRAAGPAVPDAFLAGPAAAAGGPRGLAGLAGAPLRGTVELAAAVRKELQDPLTPVLALGAMASAVVGSGVDAALVGSVMAGNALISGAQRMRAERSLGRLLAGEQPHARLVRWSPPPAGLRQGGTGLAALGSAPQDKILAAALRPGDVIALRPFDVAPADARLLAADDLEVDESTLTGESLPVSKTAGPAPGAPLAERTCMVYEGSTILAGTGLAVVVATGDATEAGRAAIAAGRAAPPTGIQARLAELTRISVPASGLGGLAVAGLGLIRGVPLRDAIASGVAVAVAAVPEGLPLVATVAQLAAARRLTRTGVLVRSSRALEALGRVDVVCFDKTGTLTEGRLAVSRVAGADGTITIAAPQADHVLQVAARACPPAGGGQRTLFHATDRAVVEAARSQAGRDEPWDLADELPFEATRGYAASLGTNAGHTCLAVKGAPEVVLPRCTSIEPGAQASRAEPGRAGAGRRRGRAAAGRRAVPLTAARRRAAQDVLNDLAAQGLRVLAVAERDLPGPPGRYHLTGNGAGGPNGHRPGPQAARPGGDGDLVENLTLAGFVAISDAPRPAARETVRKLAEAGVRVTMVTGDHPATAVAVARRLGIPHAHRVLTGAEISRLPEARQVERIGASTVFARVSPEQKVRIVQALQRAGHVVAMAGDGTNDAAAIRLADVGIGVTSRGSRSARGAADLVLTSADTLPIIDALLEGRALWARVRDAVSILVGGNAGEVAFTLLGTALTGRAPLSTRQLLLVNTLTDMLPALAVALAGAGRSRGAEQRLAEAGPVGPLAGPELARVLSLRGGATALGATVAWQAGRMTGRSRRASTMALSTLVLTQLGQTLLTSGRSPLVVATSAVSAGALVAIVEIPGVSHFFGCTPLGPVAWAMAGGSAAGATVAAAVAPRLIPWLGAAGTGNGTGPVLAG
ncbi:MAG: HAD-IC family P-type ATPase [Gemmatimonadota bacterium]